MENAAVAKRTIRRSVLIAIALALVVAASFFFLAAVGFGIGHGEMRASSDSESAYAKVNRAGNVALTVFLILDVVAAFVSSHVVLAPPHWHWSVRTLLYFAVAVGCSYIITLFFLTEPFAQVITINRTLSDWLIKIVG